jgi:hypothetical protein
MDASNLATVFAPTVFRSGMDDPLKAVMEIKFSQNILLNIIVKEHILKNAIKLFRDIYRQKNGVDRNITDNPMLNINPNRGTNVMSKDMTDEMSVISKELSDVEKSEFADITSAISPHMLSRMAGMTGGDRNTTIGHKHGSRGHHHHSGKSHHHSTGRNFKPVVSVSDNERDSEGSAGKKKSDEEGDNNNEDNDDIDGLTNGNKNRSFYRVKKAGASDEES